jgi:hypothetical protein
MLIKAKITGLEYKIKFADKLKSFTFNDFEINELPASCIIKDENFSFGLSKWVSPKRTRSYPYERVYNTLAGSKRITVIPIIKDEGEKGDRNFIQWNTVSLMSLLDIFVVFAYYAKAEKHKTRENKITNQKLDNESIKNKIDEIKNYHSSALHWNLKEIEKTFPELIQKVKSSYRKMGIQFGVEFHSVKGIDKFARQFANGVKNFMNTSRQKTKEAQHREIQTIQPKKALSTFTKATIVIDNYLGGKYYFTTDEIIIEKDKVFLIEGKHSKNALLPSKNDIKDGLLKMILYTNLKDIYIDDKKYTPLPVIKLTSTKLKNSISSANSFNKIENFVAKNNFSENQKEIIKKLFEEAKANNFLTIIEKS